MDLYLFILAILCLSCLSGNHTRISQIQIDFFSILILIILILCYGLLKISCFNIFHESLPILILGKFINLRKIIYLIVNISHRGGSFFEWHHWLSEQRHLLCRN